jgi:RimJ/RimL family protein N-acetyltransferase
VQELPATDAEDVARFFEEDRRNGSLLYLVIADAADDHYLGEAALAMMEHGVADLGCAIAPEARRAGIATEALRLITSWAHETLGVARVQVIVAPVNQAAIGLVEKAGFQREGLLRSYWEVGGERSDAFIFSRLPGDPTP